MERTKTDLPAYVVGRVLAHRQGTGKKHKSYSICYPLALWVCGERRGLAAGGGGRSSPDGVCGAVSAPDERLVKMMLLPDTSDMLMYSQRSTGLREGVSRGQWGAHGIVRPVLYMLCYAQARASPEVAGIGAPPLARIPVTARSQTRLSCLQCPKLKFTRPPWPNARNETFTTPSSHTISRKIL